MLNLVDIVERQVQAIQSLNRMVFDLQQQCLESQQRNKAVIISANKRKSWTIGKRESEFEEIFCTEELDLIIDYALLTLFSDLLFMFPSSITFCYC